MSDPHHPQTVRWEELLPSDFIESRDRYPVCWMAYGLAEPHGGYNALGLDWLKAQALAERAAAGYGGIVAPPLCWHIQELPEFHDDGKGHGWFCDVGVKQSLASSIPSDLFYRMVFHQIRAFDARGFHGAILITGHYGGIEIVLRWICEYYLRRTGSPIRLHALADWECMDRSLPHAHGDHAGVTETSQLMALRPGFTDLTRQQAGGGLGGRYAGSVNFEKGPLPSEAIGRAIVDSQVKNLGGISRELLKAYVPKAAWRAPDQHAVDEIWHRFDRLTRRYWTGCYAEYKQGLWFKFPGWEALGE